MHEYDLHHGSLGQFGPVLPILSAYGRNGVGAKRSPKLKNLPLSLSQALSLWKLVPSGLGNDSESTHNDGFSLFKFFEPVPELLCQAGLRQTAQHPPRQSSLTNPWP